MYKRGVQLLTHPTVLRVIIGINAVSFVLGLGWYAAQLRVTPWFLWPVVPDCPLAALFVAAALLLHLYGRGNVYLDALAFASAVKYGIWTVVIIGHAWSVGTPVESMGLLLFVSHVGLLVEGLLYGSLYLTRTPKAVWVPLLWFMVNDGLDYLVGVYPTLPVPGAVILARNMAILTSVVGLGFAYSCLRRGRPTSLDSLSQRR